ncbi:MAG: CsgG/HfaB family protein [Treponematales bacterium]
MKNALLGFSLPLLLSCASAPFPRAGTAPLGLDEALSLGVDYLADKLPPRAKVAVVSARAPAENLSNYLIDTAVMRLVNKDRFTVIERAELDALQKEQAYQASGEVGDEGAVSLGHQLGAEVIVTGAVMETGGRYSLRLKALDVETARILGTRMYQVKNDAALAALLRPAPGKEQNASQQTVINGSINITNNNTTTINGDVYVNKPDWF